MLLKWITCVVRGDAHDAFDRGQRRWSALTGRPGFLAQVGGWDPATGDAHVLGLWADDRSYRRFMEHEHDDVAAGRAGSYRRIAVATGPVVLPIDGELGPPADALAAGTVLRVADCRILPGRAEHLVRVQRGVWVPGMAAAQGMLGGVFARLGADRYLVATSWSGPEAHRRYVDGSVRSLRATADADTDLRSLTGHVLPLEPGWTVLGRRTASGPSTE